jgi:hypothetical protein
LKSIFHLFINLRKIVALIFHQHRYRKQEEIEIKFNILKRILDGIKQPPVIQWSIGKTCLMLNFLTYLIKNININFLKSMMAAELIDFMMNLVIYPCVVILHIIVQ